MLRNSNFVSFACLLVAVAAGCAPNTDEHTDPDLSTPGIDSGCPPEACGLNGTVLASAHFGQLNLDGATNELGMTLVDFIGRDGMHLGLDIAGSRFVGLDGQAIAAQGDDLIGSRLVIRDSAGDEWALVVEDTGAVEFLSDESGTMPVYYLSRAPASDPGQAQPLCPDGAAAALIKGERYDAETLTIDSRDTGRWFSIACQGQALWKAKRMSYDPERSANDPYHTTAAQRRATLAMITADYCGTGERFTVSGTEIYWQNRAAWMVGGSTPEDSARVEAAWNEHGAVCLDTPRLADSFARAEIEAVCGREIPRCTPELLTAAEWVTWRP